MSLLTAINKINALVLIKMQHAICIKGLDSDMLQAMESEFPGCNAAIDSINTDIDDLQSSVDSLNKIESNIIKAKKKRKHVSTNSIHSTTNSDLAKIQQENVLLKTQLQQSQQQLQQARQSLQTVSQTETDARRESQRVLSELQQVNDKLRAQCFELKPSIIMDMDNPFTSMTSKCANTDREWDNREMITLIRALEIPFIGVGFIQHHCLPRKFLQCCLSHDHSYLILTFLFFRSFSRRNHPYEL
jgi:transketolase